MRIYLLLLFLVFLPSSSFSSFFHFLFFSSFLIRLFFPTYQMTNKRQKDWTIFIELFDSFYLFTRANYFKYYTVTGGSYRCTTILRKIVLLFFFSFPPSIVFFPSFSFFPLSFSSSCSVLFYDSAAQMRAFIDAALFHGLLYW